MTNPLIIDGYDAFDTFGVYLADATLRELVQMPKFKASSFDTNDWHEEPGLEADLSNPVFDGRQFQMQFHCTRRQLDATAHAFVDYLSQQVYHTFYFPLLQMTWTLRYVSSPSSKINEYFDTFTLTFCDDNPTIQATAPASQASFQSQYAIDSIRFSYYGTYETKGTLSSFHPLNAVKDSLSHSESGSSGIYYDSQGLRKERYPDIKLSLHIRTATVADFWLNYHALFYALTKLNDEGQAIHSVTDGVLDIKCYYKSSSVTRFTLLQNNTVNGAGVWCDFTLTLAVLDVVDVPTDWSYLTTQQADAVVSQNPYPEFIIIDPAEASPSEDDELEASGTGSARGVKITDLPSVGTALDIVKHLLTIGVDGNGQSVQVSLGGIIENLISSIGGSVRLTQAQFDELTVIDERRWYFVTNSSGKLIKIYAGSTLFAKADSSGSMGFPYTFPLTFTS